MQAETGLTAIVQDHFGEALSEPRGDSCSHADVYTGLQGVVAVLAALHHPNRTGEGQHVDVSMAATMLSVNEPAGAMLSEIDTDGEPIALSANESYIYEMANGTRLTIAGSPLYSPMFTRYCAMMRRSDFLTDPRYATACSANTAQWVRHHALGLAALDTTATWDLHAHRAGIPLGIAMGGEPRGVPVYGSGGFNTNQSDVEAADVASSHLARGLRGVRPRVAGVPKARCSRPSDASSEMQYM